MKAHKAQGLLNRIEALNPTIAKNIGADGVRIGQPVTGEQAANILIEYLEDVLWWVSRGREGKEHIAREGVPA